MGIFFLILSIDLKIYDDNKNAAANLKFLMNT